MYGLLKIYKVYQLEVTFEKKKKKIFFLNNLSLLYQQNIYES